MFTEGQLFDDTVYGLQFHPESILTNGGLRIIQNFIGGMKK